MINYRRVFILVAAVFVFCLPKNSDAQRDWSMYESKSKLYQVAMPGTPVEEASIMRIGDNEVVYATETYAFVDQRPFKDILKNYVVKSEQTIGKAIPLEARTKLLEKEIQTYLSSYSDKNITVVERGTYASYSGNVPSSGWLAFHFEDENENRQGVRIKISISGSTKYYQIYSGPEDDLFSNKTNRFFDSFNSVNGYVLSKGSMNEDWKLFTSPKSIFSVKIPEITPPYFKEAPKVTKIDEDTERVGMVFLDPIWRHQLFYNITGYRFNQEMSFALAEEILLEEYLNKHGRNMVGITLKKDFDGDIPYIATAYQIKPHSSFPYLDSVKIRLMFLGNYMVVQELVGSSRMVNSLIANNFFPLINFTPKVAFQKHKEMQSKPAQDIKSIINAQ